jgi:SAM-dependent methyltransferase
MYTRHQSSLKDLEYDVKHKKRRTLDEMIVALKARLKEASYRPSFLGLLVNPYYIIRCELFRAIRALSKGASGDVLDVGCGSKPYEHLFQGASSYIGCDVQSGAHDHSLSKVDYFYDGRTLPFAAERYDWVVSFETLEHIFEPNAVLREMHRVTKKEGYLLISVPFCWDEHEVPYDFGRYTSYGLTYLLEKNGYTVVRYIKTGNYILALAQLFMAYLAQHLLPRNRYVRVMCNVFVITPLVFVAYFLNLIFPHRDELFLNSVVLCKKQA